MIAGGDRPGTSHLGIDATVDMPVSPLQSLRDVEVTPGRFRIDVRRRTPLDALDDAEAYPADCNFPLDPAKFHPRRFGFEIDVSPEPLGIDRSTNDAFHVPNRG
mgnify:CR=1 FL=1